MKYLAILAGLLALGATPTLAQPIAPYKDALFAYGEQTASRDNGRFLDVPYDPARDIDRRDAVPERRVDRAYVDMAPRRSERSESWHTRAGVVEVAMAGQASQPRFVLLFVHGKGGDRSLGMNDWTFGGNFNRAKNLAARNQGLYMTMSAGLFAAQDMRRAQGLVLEIAERFPQARIVMACASMGSQVCWSMAAEPAAARLLAGMVVLGGQSSAADLSRMLAARDGKPLPMIVAHGTRDRVYDHGQQMDMVTAVASRDRAYPIRFIGFDGGSHGTPIRMLDWRDALNWLLDRG